MSGKERKVKSLSCVWLLVTPKTAAYQAPPSMGFSRQEYWSGLPFPSPKVSRDTIIVQSLSHVCSLQPMDCSRPSFLVLHHLPEFVQTHVHWVGDVIQPSHSLSPSSSPALNLSQHQGLFQWVGSGSGGQSIGASASASVLPVNIQGWFPLGLTGFISL